jgi:pyrimidine-nucleoside phosphorylase
MRMVDIIIKKRDGGELSREEIVHFVESFTRGETPDYQAAALAMAILLKGMTPRETTDLTLAMAHSGRLIQLSGVVPFAVDKHSTGGVGDKTTLVVEPLVAACGLPVGKMSGRGLGFSGGTIDKLESIPGFRVNLSIAEFLHQLEELGLVLTGQSADLAPADGKLYALRDVTGTVQSIPLIASSVMSKKIAAGAQGIVLDVKWGLGAFMKSLDQARELAEWMVQIAHLAGRKAVALLADMNQPLGCAVGNALEVKEAIDTLQGGGPQDFRQHCLTVAAHMLTVGGKAPGVDAALGVAESALDAGLGWQKFRALISAQGGDLAAVDNPSRLPAAQVMEAVPSPQSGFLREIHAQKVGEAAVTLGAGRAQKGDPIDPAVGVIIHHKVGDFVETGQPLCTIHANSRAALDEARRVLLDAHAFSAARVERLALFSGVVGG